METQTENKKIKNMEEQIQTITKALMSEIQRNKESDEKIAKILVNQAKVLKTLVGKVA